MITVYIVGGPSQGSIWESCGGGGVSAGVSVVVVAEKDPTAVGGVNEVAVNEDDPLRAKDGGFVVAMGGGEGRGRGGLGEEIGRAHV